MAAGFTVRVALAAPPLAPALVVRAPAGMVLAYAPVDAAVTSIDTVHVPFAGIEPPLIVTLPAVLVTVAPAQVVAGLPPPDRVMPAPGATGNVSVRLVTLITPAFGLPSVILKRETVPDTMVAGANALATVGAAAVTVRLAVFDTGPAAVCPVVTPEVVVGQTPTAPLVTGMVTVQLPEGGMVSDENVSAVCPAANTLPLAPKHVPPAGPAA